MAAVTVYRWDDAGAPQISNGMNRDVYAVLDAVLCNGYGNKSPLGWNQTLSNVTQRGYQNKGSGKSLFLRSASGADDDSGINLCSAHAVTGADQLFRPGYFQSTRVFAENAQWIVIGNDTAFYWFSSFSGSYDLSSNKYSSSFFAGDLLNTAAHDNAAFVAFASVIDREELKTPINPSDRYGENLEYLNGISAARTLTDFGLRIWDADNEENMVEYQLFKAFDEVSYSETQGNIPHNNLLFPLYVYLKDGQSMVDRNGTPCSNSSIQPIVRGVLPGLYSSLIAHDNNVEWPHFQMFEQRHLLIRSTKYRGGSKLWLAVESW